MEKVKGDYSEVAGFSSGQIPAGKYACRAEKVEVRQKYDNFQQKDIRSLNWTFKILNARDAKFNGRHIYYNTPLEGKFAFHLNNLMKSFDTNYKASVEFDPEAYIGSYVELNVTYRYEGQKYPDVTKVGPYFPPGSAVKALEADEEMPF